MNTKSQRPCQCYIDIEFKKEIETTFFSYLVFQNFYCHQITIKQFCGKSSNDMKDDKMWRTILKNYTLMQNPHYETDAQNWHIIGTELVSCFLSVNSFLIVQQQQVRQAVFEVPQNLFEIALSFLAGL